MTRGRIVRGSGGCSAGSRPGRWPVDERRALSPHAGIVCSMEPSLAAAIHEELRAFVSAAGSRRSLPTTCHVGHPGGEHARWPHEVTNDTSLRADLVERALDGLLETEGACVWLTRGGGPEVCDADADWFAAARTAFARHGLPLTSFFVLTRTTWVDLVTDERRRWTRIRSRSPGAPR
jgi:hypothetical protein